jgi:hypothetical protein
LTILKKFGKIYIEKRKGDDTMYKAIYFDMDGTIAGLYQVDGWLDSLIAEQTKPYREAKPLVNMRQLAKVLNTLKAQGWKIGIISWLAKNSNPAIDMAVTQAKRDWLKKHLASVEFDEIKIVPYGTPKETAVEFPEGILFGDEAKNREGWTGKAYTPEMIMEILEAL